MVTLAPENPDCHGAAIEALYDRTFGPGHFAKTAERLREGSSSLPALSRVGLVGSELVAVCRLWPLEVGFTPSRAVFVGPVAVDPQHRGGRLGLRVTQAALEAAAADGWSTALIIGDPGYFGEIGFHPVASEQITLPGPQDMARVMVRHLRPGADPLSGLVCVPRI